MNITSPRAELWADSLDRFDGFSCDVETSDPDDRAECTTVEPERLHIALVQIDVEIHN